MCLSTKNTYETTMEGIQKTVLNISTNAFIGWDKKDKQDSYCT